MTVAERGGIIQKTASIIQPKRVQQRFCFVGRLLLFPPSSVCLAATAAFFVAESASSDVAAQSILWDVATETTRRLKPQTEERCPVAGMTEVKL